MISTVTQPITKIVQKEPVLFWQLLAGAANLIQLLAIPVAPWLHIVIVVVSWVAATLATRRQVTPIKAPSANG